MLPPELVAQTPLKSREQSRLLCMDRNSGALEHHHFFMLPELLREGDCLVLNDSRVLPARLIGHLETGVAVEVLLLHETRGRFSCPALLTEQDKKNVSLSYWECLVKPGKKIKPGVKILFGNGELTATVIDIKPDGNRIIEFSPGTNEAEPATFLEVLDRLGKMPLPPYIHEKLEDAERYQTVYSKQVGSAAAPTAGLHFTEEILEKLNTNGVNIQFLTLHVGLGTFRPVKTDNIKDHEMHSEYYILSEETAEAVNQTKANTGRVIAVGTTSCRVLETCSDETGKVSARSGSTDIFIYPGYKFKCIDGLITNFHLPESTLIMLVSAFAGKKNTLTAYTEAIKEKYRFYSLGDAMYIR